jgi:hypothetical protein
MVSMATRVLSGPGVRSQFAELVAPLTPVFVASGDQDELPDFPLFRKGAPRGKWHNSRR